MHTRIDQYRTCHRAYHQLFMDAHQQLRAPATQVLADLATRSGAAIGKRPGSLTSFVAGDPYQTAFNEGKRYLFNYLAHQLHLTPQQLQQLLQAHEQGDTHQAGVYG